MNCEQHYKGKGLTQNQQFRCSNDQLPVGRGQSQGIFATVISRECECASLEGETQVFITSNWHHSYRDWFVWEEALVSSDLGDRAMEGEGFYWKQGGQK